MAVPTAIFAMVASMGLAGVAVMSSIDAQHGTKRDRNSKAAIAAADAGAGVALLRLNRFTSSLSEANPCVGPSGEFLTPSGGWCPATESESVGNASFSYMVSAFEEDTPLSVIAVGTAGGVSRRIEVGLVSYNGDEVFADENLIGQDNITIEGDSDVRTSLGTNGDIVKNGNSATICGDVRHGVGKGAPQPDCDGEVTEGFKNLPPVIPPDDIATNNSNCRLADDCEDPNEEDTYSKKRTATKPWDPETRKISLSGGSSLTMGGRDYFICELEIQSGELIMAAGEDVNVRIFFDTPENCGLSAGATQVMIAGNGRVKSTGYNPDEGKYALPVFFLLGSPEIPTRVELTGNSTTNEMLIYAPYSEIDIGGTGTLIGMAAGKSLKIHGSPTIISDPGIAPPAIFYESLWERTRYVECIGATGSPPDANC
jgi:hypothetical protein